MKSVYKRVFLIVPSKIMARGIETVLCETGEFRVEGILTDLSHSCEIRLKNISADVIIIDPVISDYMSRLSVRERIAAHSDAAVVALKTTLMDEEQMRQYDGVINLYDEPSVIVRKLRDSISPEQERREVEAKGLSAREKEILICVAKGMLNKEIADVCNLSIHTVITHRKNITRKTGIKTVAGLVVYALFNNLIDPGSIDL